MGEIVKIKKITIENCSKPNYDYTISYIFDDSGNIGVIHANKVVPLGIIVRLIEREIRLKKMK